MKRAAAAVGTAIALAAVFLATRSGAPAQRATTPELAIEQMFLAAERGDVDRYLDLFTGAQREQLDRELAGESREAFARSLMDSVTALKGHAIQGTTGEPPAPGDEMVDLPVERVYAHHNELQTYRLRRQADVWRIESVHSPQRQQPPIAYGTPVFAAPPEAGLPAAASSPGADQE